MSESKMMDSPDLFEDLEMSMEIDPFADEIPESHGHKNHGESSSKSWKGAPISDVIGADSPLNGPEFPKIVPAYNHTVLFHIFKSKPSVHLTDCPSPQQGKDIWSKDYVRMPCSPQSLYPVEKEGQTVLQNRWELIKSSLLKPINNSFDLEKAILEYNYKYRGSWKFTSLHKLFNEYLEDEESDHFFKNTLPLMIELALKLPQIIPNAIPLLRQHHNRSISLSQQQAACLLANAFFCTFPRRNSRKPKSEYYTYPDINFNSLFQCAGSKSILEKLKCLCHYFRRVCIKVPCGVLTFMRKSVENSKCPNWSKSNMKIGSIPLHIDSNGTIEDNGVGLLQVDFANKYLGGGVLGYGCVQEEIRFIICPELLVSMLFTEVLKPDEALFMLGCERFSDYAGYADSFEWSGNHIDATSRDSCGRLKCGIIAIDALYFTNPNIQYKPEYIIRELKKAWVGFSVYSDEVHTGTVFPGVATGNWGCGAFRGSPYLKSLLQLMACSVARRPMAYYTFGDVELRDDIINIYNFLSTNNIVVGDLFRYLCEFYNSSASSDQLYSFILQFHKDSQKREQRNSNIFQSKNFYGEKSHPNVPVPIKLNKNVIETENKIESFPKKEMFESNSSDIEIINETTMKKNDTCDQQSTSRSFFDSIANTDLSSMLKRESPARKNVLSFFEKNSSKSTKSDSEKMDTCENNSPIDLKENSDKLDSRAENEVQPRKTGKISDYFQRLQKH